MIVFVFVRKLMIVTMVMNVNSRGACGGPVLGLVLVTAPACMTVLVRLIMGVITIAVIANKNVQKPFIRMNVPLNR